MEEAEAPRLSSGAAETVPEDEEVAREAGVANENATAAAGALETAEELVHVGVLSPG